MRFVFLGGMIVAAVAISNVAGQAKKDDAKRPEPRVTVVAPLGLQPGTSGKLVIRGVHLDGATKVRFADAVGEAKIASKGRVEAPDKNTEKFGDTQVVVDVQLDAKAVNPVAFTIVTPHGETKPHAFLVETSRPVVKEIEPNDGFRNAQPLERLPAVVVEGQIERPLDVDVYAFLGKKGQTLKVETQAARHGSAFDPHLTIYREGAIELDVSGKRLGGDAAIELVLPRDDRYFIVLSDAVDGGGPIHVYRLAVELK